MRPLTISPIHAFSDNYIWMLSNGSGAFVVDPGDADPVLETLSQMQLKLSGIFITHHHFDHTGGLAALQSETG
ncbi:MAG: MBL fold metallo-hydrolase, partial [Halieaceae bacterium]